ncbi:tryptophan 2,3-dioxygenase [Macrococcoides canis]|uniref:tryptophan 2,3-dioxygenase n=1 Tax=Macrococcoides canis TaxID=1855823 RepID=UPI00207CD03E|nr:tryptophan 2,3-dioxygenase [Macrococcus canis]MCO4095590.1 tryptophan 2,3-dioxygenase [Macrococcus canis]UTH08304.1 tryptophan 2,3-dioxygenase [Macrococcus canis]
MKCMNKVFDNEKHIHTDFKQAMTYSSYLSLDTLLNSHHPLSDHHDEMLFITVHHVSEIWMKQLLHELKAAIDNLEHNEFRIAFKNLARISNIQEQIINVWDVLSTLTPSEYLQFRDKLGHSSGFQSYQNRLIEFYLGYKTDYILKIYAHDENIYQQLKAAYDSPSLYDVAIKKLHEQGFNISESVLNRPVQQAYSKHDDVKAAWKHIYEHHEAYFELYELAEELMDIEDRFQQWRFRHMKTVERIIGFKMGTGGSNGVNYLKKVLDQYFFPELWELRTEL